MEGKRSPASINNDVLRGTGFSRQPMSTRPAGNFVWLAAQMGLTSVEGAAFLPGAVTLRLELESDIDYLTL